MKKEVANHCELFSAVTCVVCDGREEGVFVELNSKIFCAFRIFGLRCLYLVFAVEVAPNPVETRGSSFVDNETRWVSTDGLHRLFDGIETVLGSWFRLLRKGGFRGQSRSKSRT